MWALMGMPQKLERYRLRVLRYTLQDLDLQPPPEDFPRPPRSPLPQFLVSLTLHRPHNPFGHLQPGVVSGGYETFEFRSLSSVAPSIWADIRERAAHHTVASERRIWVLCPEGLPDQSVCTPHFNLARYF